MGGNGSYAWGDKWWEKAFDSAVATVDEDSSDSSDSDSGASAASGGALPPCTGPVARRSGCAWVRAFAGAGKLPRVVGLVARSPLHTARAVWRCRR